MASAWSETRRDFLACGAAFTGAAFAAAPFAAAHAASDSAPLGAVLRALLGDLDEPLRLGHAYLAARPSEADRAALTRALGADRAPVPMLAAWLDRRRRQDFARGAVVVVEGWVLARLEARGCALLALS